MKPPEKLSAKLALKWFNEATGTFTKPYKIKYVKPFVYVWSDKADEEVELYHIGNIYGECEDVIKLSNSPFA